jgi:hypothetical protein
MKDLFSKAYYWLYRLLKYSIIGNLKTEWQRFLSPSHLAPYDAWECSSQLVKKIYPYLLNFKNAKRIGIPIFEGSSPQIRRLSAGEENEQFKTNEKKWEDILDKILFAFEYTYQECFSDRLAKKLKRKIAREYGDVDKVCEENKCYHLWRTVIDDNGREACQFCNDPTELTEKDKETLRKENGEDWLEKSVFYYNSALHVELEIKAQEGFKLFGEYFGNLWD